MLGIANYAMKGPTQAYSLAVLFAILTIWFAPIGILWGALIVLVTLRVGIAEGAKVLAASSIAALGLASLITGSIWPAIVSIIEYALPVWAFAVYLRQTQSLEKTLVAIVGVMAFAIFGFHMAVVNPGAWWLQVLNTTLQPILSEANMDIPAEALSQFTNMLTFLIGMFMVMLWFAIVLIGRWWQGSLYYPGKFQHDFYRLKLPASLAYAAVALSLLGLIFSDNSLLMDLSGVVMAGLMFQGLAIAHMVLSNQGRSKFWLITLYILIFLVPQTILILATIALLDIWMDFRKLNAQNTSSEE